MNGIKLSVCVITYNQGAFIPDMIEGILSQETDFDIEVIISDDCSTDNTSELLREYSQKYSIIKWLRNDSNLGPTLNFAKALQNCRGEYIAICEGDDYWIDSYKLQKQVDFIEENRDFIACCSAGFKLYDGNLVKEASFSQEPDQEIRIEHLISENKIITASFLFKRTPQIEKYFDPSIFKLLPFCDYFLNILCVMNGKVFCFKDEMAVYRIHSSGIWTSKKKADKIVSTLSFFILLKRMSLGIDPSLLSLRIRSLKKNFLYQLFRFPSLYYFKEAYLLLK